MLYPWSKFEKHFSVQNKPYNSVSQTIMKAHHVLKYFKLTHKLLGCFANQFTRFYMRRDFERFYTKFFSIPKFFFERSRQDELRNVNDPNNYYLTHKSHPTSILLIKYVFYREVITWRCSLKMRTY